MKSLFRTSVSSRGAFAACTASVLICALSAPALLASGQQGGDAAAPLARPLSLEQQAALRCSAAFAVMARHQAQGSSFALQYPALAERGREFFVLTAAKLMDDTALSREVLSEHLAREAARFQDRAMLEAQMPACLLLLDASGL
jgi:hypothetical protein